MKILTVLLLAFTSASLSVSASAQTVVTMNRGSEKGIGKEIGTITVTESKFGLVFTPMLEGLPPGLHGFHVHQNSSCEPKEKDGKMVAGLAAGGHLDPKGSNKHGEPWGEGIYRRFLWMLMGFLPIPSWHHDLRRRIWLVAQ